MLNKPGLESPNKIIHSYYENKVCVLIVYDISSRKSFEIATRWIEDFKKSSPKKVLMALVGNKSNSEKKRVVTEEEGRKFAVKNGILFYQTSAKIDENIEEVFKQSDSEMKDTSFEFNKTNLKENKKRCCCCCKCA